MTNHVMLDIETLDTAQTAVVTEIGVIVFDDNFNKIDSFALQVEIVPQIFKGRTISQETVEWWSHQDRELLDKFVSHTDKFDPQDALIAIRERLAQHLTQNSLLWANGIMFDVGIIDSLCESFDVQKLSSMFYYNNVRDYRTLLRYAMHVDHETVDLHAASIVEGTKHDALADCQWQLSMLQCLYTMLVVD